LRSAIERSKGSATPTRRRCWPRVATASAAMVAVLAAATGRLFVFPAQGMPAHVNAIVMFDGLGNPGRLATALRLAEERRAPMLVVSQGTRLSEVDGCPPPVPLRRQPGLASRGERRVSPPPGPSTTCLSWASLLYVLIRALLRIADCTVRASAAL
jgi:hypothetical protein